MGVAVNPHGQGKATQPEAEWRSAPCPGEQLAEGGGGAKSESGSERGGLTGRDGLGAPEPSVSSLTV